MSGESKDPVQPSSQVRLEHDPPGSTKQVPHDDALHISVLDANALKTLRGLPGRYHEDAGKIPGILRVCCTTSVGLPSKCIYCNPSDCEIEVDPISSDGPWDVVIGASDLGKNIEFVHGEYRDVLVLDRTRDISAQLQPWHEKHFGTGQERIYVLYEVTAGDGIAPETPAGSVAGKIIAIPFERKATR